MGGDYGPEVTVPAALKALQQHKNLKLILVGNSEIINAKLAKIESKHKDRLEVVHASEQVMMDEPPAKALRMKKDSSMRVAINLVKNKVSQACVSAGNTGALMATARFVLKTFPGIDRPAIIASFPTSDDKKEVRMLDLGANVDTDANYLYQFAILASVMVSIVDNVKAPKVALLNIGSEEIKGNEQVKRAAQLLAENKYINYVGFVEGDQIFTGAVDVVVCDGFIGNSVLKSIEGMVKLIGYYAKKAFTKNVFTRLLAMTAYPLLKSLWRQLDPARHNGATFIGLQGIVIKSHGGANIASFVHAIEEAIIEVEKNVPQRIHDELNKVLFIR
ncbi:MAG: phosphate acyltransferase PlsX [Gammaproteobacteria bacterium]|nr:phosphate acyltransferase PlsX [Gammaproteobacteria bacterium]